MSESAAAAVISRPVVHWTLEELSQLQPWVDDRTQKVDDIARKFTEVHPHRNFEAVRQKVYKMRRQADGTPEPIRRGSTMPPASGTLTSMLPPPSLPPPAPVPQTNGEPRRSTLRPTSRAASTVPPAAEPRMTLELANGSRVRGTVDQIAALLKRLESGTT